jgi:hypothetical protein
MVAVGLLYVGAVLFVNGLMLIGVVPGKSAAILNFFVGAMMVVFPTIILIQAQGEPGVVFGAAGLFLFGFTYLYIAIMQVAGISAEGFGWYAVFVSASALTIGILQFTLVGDPLFGVIWIIWALLWFMFFLVFALNKMSLLRTTGWFTILLAHITATIPGFLLLTGTYVPSQTNAMIMAALGVVTLIISIALGRRVPKPVAA